MTSLNDTQAKVVFGVAGRLSNVFGVLRQRLVFFVVFSVVMGVVAFLPLALALAFYQEQQVALLVIAGLLAAFVMLIWNCVLILAAQSSIDGRPLNLGEFIGVSVKRLPVVLLCMFLVVLCLSLGMVLALFPIIGILFVLVWFLWAGSAFSVVLPSILIEGTGFGALARSWNLTKGYRWSIAGMMFVLYLIVMLIGFAVQLPVLFFGENAIIIQFVGIFISLFLNVLFPIAFTVTYARLRVIKEGVSEDVSNVFA